MKRVKADLGLVAKNKNKRMKKSNASYFINYVIAQVSEKYGDDAIYKDGLKFILLSIWMHKMQLAAMQNFY